jgi:hypothetical protein
MTEMQPGTAADPSGEAPSGPGLDPASPIWFLQNHDDVETWGAENPSALLETTENPPPALLNYLYGFVAGFGQKP